MASYTNFCCRSGGSNLNAGSRTGDTTEPGTTAALTYASGSWVQSTGVFTVASGNPVSDGVAVGDFASVYADGSTITGFVGRVTARTSTTITVSLTAKSGSAPANGTSNRTLKIGGAWAGPSAGVSFPWGFVEGNLTNSNGDRTRVNIKNDKTYSTTSAWTHGNGGSSITFQGYNSAYDDEGKTTFDGGTTGSSYVLLTVNGSSQFLEWIDLIFQNNGATGTANLVSFSVAVSNHQFLRRCVFANCRGSGLVSSSAPNIVVECEAYNCCQGNPGGSNGGFVANGETIFISCISHGNAGSGSNGFVTTGNNATSIHFCISANNGNLGFYCNTGGGGIWIESSDAYNNGSHGIQIPNSSRPFFVRNCNLIKNGGWGVTGLGSTPYGVIYNCGFGSGTQANTSGQVDTVLSAVKVTGSVTYASGVTPWKDPANGDFSITLAQAKQAGRGNFTEVAQGGYSGTQGFPDIGAAQSKPATAVAHW